MDDNNNTHAANDPNGNSRLHQNLDIMRAALKELDLQNVSVDTARIISETIKAINTGEPSERMLSAVSGAQNRMIRSAAGIIENPECERINETTLAFNLGSGARLVFSTDYIDQINLTGQRIEYRLPTAD